jgi:hypothetical protein
MSYCQAAQTLFVLFVFVNNAHADAFDNYINTILKTIPDSKSAEKVTKLTREVIDEHNRVLPGLTSTFVVVRTNDNRWAKLLVQHAGQKVADKEILPIIVLERYVTYREGEDRTIHAFGQNVRLFDGFQFNLDLGQVVPKNVSADLKVGVDANGFAYLEAHGKAEMYVVTKHLKESDPVKTPKLIVGAKFEMRYFNGDYKLWDDGRRSGTLSLKVDDNGDVRGHYTSDKDGKKYDVSGKVSNAPLHKIEFVVSYPQTSQFFTGFMFTGNGRAIAGSSTLEKRETGFYAERIETAK